MNIKRGFACLTFKIHSPCLVQICIQTFIQSLYEALGIQISKIKGKAP